jgi:uncharacterized coiled-coil protein SlyX
MHRHPAASETGMASHDRKEQERVWLLALENAKRRLVAVEERVADQIALIAALRRQYYDTTQEEAVLDELKAKLQRMYADFGQHVERVPQARHR